MAHLGINTPQNLIQAAKGQSGIEQISKSANALRLEKSAKAAEEFEAVFIAEMLKPMFEMIEVDSVFGGGKGEEVFRGMMVQEYGKMISAQGGLGIASQVKAELLKLQESSQTNTPQTTGETA